MLVFVAAFFPIKSLLFLYNTDFFSSRFYSNDKLFWIYQIVTLSAIVMCHLLCLYAVFCDLDRIEMLMR